MSKVLKSAIVFTLSIAFLSACVNDNDSSQSSEFRSKSENSSQTDTSIPSNTNELVGENSTVENNENSKPKIDSSDDVDDVIEAFKLISSFKTEKSNEYIDYQKKNPDFSAEEVVIYVNIGLNREFYTDIVEIENPDSITVFANKYRQLPKGYEPSDLKKIPEEYSKSWRELYLREEALEQFIKLCDDAKEKGLNIYASSAYRSYSYQSELYNNYVNSDGKENADRYSSRAGHSEHQTGLAIDVRTNEVEYEKFGSTEEYQWVKQNAHKYGYVIHYTEENEWITGFITEAWHLRYIGVEHATKVHESGLVLDAYLVNLN